MKAITGDEDNLVANMANASALLMQEMKQHWIGFYLVDSDRDELVLGPFQGPLACTRIPFGKGVCGSAWKQKKTLNVPNVHEFDGHIACSSLTNSEIVIPIIKDNIVVAVLDIDSIQDNDFNDEDVAGLESIAKHLKNLF